MKSRRNKKANTISRREFLKGSAVAAGTAVVWPTIVPSSVFGAAAPSNRITIGCIGVGRKGSGNMKAFKGNSGAEVVAVCDIDAGNREKARQTAGLDARSSYNDFVNCWPGMISTRYQSLHLTIGTYRCRLRRYGRVKMFFAKNH